MKRDIKNNKRKFKEGKSKEIKEKKKLGKFVLEKERKKENRKDNRKFEKREHNQKKKKKERKKERKKIVQP